SDIENKTFYSISSPLYVVKISFKTVTLSVRSCEKQPVALMGFYDNSNEFLTMVALKDINFQVICIINNNHFTFVLDSQGSEEYIDFTMIITSRNNAPISNYGGGFRCKSEYHWCIIQVKRLTFSNSFQKNREKQKKNDGKTRIFTQNQFST
ncbi:Uncharacterized protein FWK35_00031624, partial [Aphis craccivora]